MVVNFSIYMYADWNLIVKLYLLPERDGYGVFTLSFPRVEETLTILAELDCSRIGINASVRCLVP